MCSDLLKYVVSRFSCIAVRVSLQGCMQLSLHLLTAFKWGLPLAPCTGAFNKCEPFGFPQISLLMQGTQV